MRPSKVQTQIKSKRQRRRTLVKMDKLDRPSPHTKISDIGSTDSMIPYFPQSVQHGVISQAKSTCQEKMCLCLVLIGSGKLIGKC